MKAIRKIIGMLIVGCALACCLFQSSPQAFAIEGLHVSVQSSNAVLSWPSDYDSGETFLVQYRQTLNATDAWQTLADYLPADYGTNFTFFTHSNSVHYPPAGSGGGTNIGNISPFAFNATAASAPLAIPANGAGAAVPLALYPPGLDLSGFTIFDPATGESMSGKGYVMSTPSITSRHPAGFQPMGEEEESSDTNQYTGFYRVVRDGVHIYGLTNGMVLSGEMQFPIEFAVNSTDQVVGVTFYDENDAPIIGASAQGSGNHWVLDWNTSMSFNGDYNIYAELNFASDDPVVSAPVAVTVNNVISFPNYFSRVFGDQIWIYAQTIPNAAYSLDLYDGNTNYLGSFDDYADGNGTISFVWDLTDGNGHAFDSTNFFGVFTVDTSSLNNLLTAQTSSLRATASGFQTATLTNKVFHSKIMANGMHPNGAGSSASANQLWTREPYWAPNNNWVVAYGSLTGDSTVDQRGTYMIAGGAGSPTDYYGVLGTLDAYGLHGNLSPGNNAQAGTVFTLHDQTTRSNLLDYLSYYYNYENFYYFGHGNNSVISAYNAAQTAITEDQIAFAAGNVPLSDSIIHAAYHPYRFVFIDACNTGKGNFCESFGIPAMTVSTNFFAAAGVESRAFIGFTKPTGFNTSNSSGDPNSWPNRSIMMSEFLNAWLFNQGDLNTIVQQAKNSFGNYGYKMDPSVIIYGAYDLMRNTRTRP